MIPWCPGRITLIVVDPRHPDRSGERLGSERVAAKAMARFAPRVTDAGRVPPGFNRSTLAFLSPVWSAYRNRGHRWAIPGSVCRTLVVQFC